MYNIFIEDYVNALMHKQGGKKGMKWGYNDGKPNGKRKAGDKIQSSSEVDLPENYSKLSLEDELLIGLQEKAHKWLLNNTRLFEGMEGENMKNMFGRPGSPRKYIETKFFEPEYNPEFDKYMKEIDKKYENKNE